MKSFNKLFAAVSAVFLAIFAAADIIMCFSLDPQGGRPYRVEAARIAVEIAEKGLENTDLSECEYVYNVQRYSNDKGFFDSNSDYIIKEVKGELYRFDYQYKSGSGKELLLVTVNGVILLAFLTTLGILFYIRQKILLPFRRLSNIPRELSKGNLTMPLKENKSRFFGEFIWGVDMLREKMEQQKQRELELQKSKKTLLLSLSHDIKTPLSAIMLYSQALSKGLYSEKEKQGEIAESIIQKAAEIENYVKDITKASREDFLSLEVNLSDFYLSALIDSIRDYYTEKLSLIQTEFFVGKYEDCLLTGDLDRGIEVIQNLMENAVKYGDGREISIDISEEEGCILITVVNSGCTLSQNDLPHIFESFSRGANAAGIGGSGLGLYISRSLMHKMKGEIFAEIKGENMQVTAVFSRS